MGRSYLALPLLVGFGALFHATPSSALQTVCTAAWTTGVSSGATTAATPLSGGSTCPSPTVNTTLTVGSGANAGTFNASYNWGGLSGSSNFPTTSNTSMDVGINPSTTETITVTFSQLVYNPFLYFGYTDNNDSFTFSNAFALRQANNAVRSGNSVVTSGAGNGANDGFVVQMLGSYGPGSNLSFVYNNTATTGAQSVTFTVGANSVPGPLPLLGAGMAFGFSRRLRQRLQG